MLRELPSELTMLSGPPVIVTAVEWDTEVVEVVTTRVSNTA
jgi:hypothetical protein